MLTDAGTLKVMDFGIARVSGTERMTSDGIMVGTPAYMAPEQVRGEEVDGRTDLYAVGVVFYRLLTAKLPFKAETAVSMIQSQLNDQPTPAREVRIELPDWLDAVLMRALAKRPADRYQTADEFRRALDSLDGLGALALLPDDVTMAAPAAPRVVAAPAAAATPAPGPNLTTTIVFSRSHLAVAVAFGAMLLAVIGLLAWVALRRPAPVQVVTIPAPAAATPSAAQAAPAPKPPRPAATRAATPAPVPVTPPETKPAPTQAVVAPHPVEMPAPPIVAAIAPVEFPSPSRIRGGRGRGMRVPPAANEEFQPIVIRDLHAIAVLNGRPSRIVEAIVTFSEKAIAATDSRNGFTVKTFPYSAVTHATLSRSRKPQGTGGATLEMLGAIPEGNIVARAPRLWATIETADDRLVLRLEQTRVRPLLEIVARRAKVQIERYMEPEP